MPDNTLSGEFKLSGEIDTEGKASEKDEVTAHIEKPAHKSNPHFFSSFCYYPKNIKFADQEKDEEIILLIRRHFIVNVPWIFTSLVLAVIGPFIIPPVLNSLPINTLTNIHYMLLFSFYYLVIFGFALMKFTLWYFHVGLVTNKRIKDIDIHGILFKDISEARVQDIQDVNNKQIGFIPSLFNYGDVFVQTAGAKPNIEFDRAPKPVRIARILADMMRTRH